MLVGFRSLSSPGQNASWNFFFYGLITTLVDEMIFSFAFFWELHMVCRACVVQSVTSALSLLEEIMIYHTIQYNFIVCPIHGFSETNYNINIESK